MTTYEAHITFPGSLHAMVERLAGASWKFSMMLDDPVLGKGKYCYLTAYDADLQNLIERVEEKAARCAMVNVPALRVKIEEEVYDRKIDA